MTTSTDSIKLSFIGDLLCHKDLIDASYNPDKDNYDFYPVFSEIKSKFIDSDYVVGNLEAPLAGKEALYTQRNISAGFNAPDAYLEALKDMGVKLFTTANNHCYDKGEEGLLRTIEVLDSVGVDHIGTYASQEQHDKVFTIKIKGVTLAFLNYTFGINYCVHHHAIPKNKQYMVNMCAPPEIHQYESLWNTFPKLLSLKIHPKLLSLLTGTVENYHYSSLCNNMINNIKRAKEAGADLIIVLPHMGIEFITTPFQFSKELVDMLFFAGADIIIGGHPHVVQPMEFRKIVDQEGNEKTGFVIYSLGNFISGSLDDWPTKLCRASIILNLFISRDPITGKCRIDSASYVPTWIDETYSDKKRLIKVIPISESLSLNPLTNNLPCDTYYLTLIKINRIICNILLGDKYLSKNAQSQYILNSSETIVKYESLPSELLPYYFKKVPLRICYELVMRLIRILNPVDK